jgi:aromatic ring-opening dioxygenase LigB subunit
LSNDSPAGFNPNGAKFDQKIQELVAGNNVAGLIKMKPELVAEAEQCGYRAMLILFGILDKMNFRTDIMSYEAPLGVGYLTVKFELG